MMTPARKLSPRTEYRLRRNEHVNSSPTLAEKFPTLKKLAANLEYFAADGIARTGGMKCKLNVLHARSILSFNCVHSDCVGADYDLSRKLAQAISTSQKSVHGEIHCQGMRHNQNLPEPTPCEGILRYKLTLGY